MLWISIPFQLTPLHAQWKQVRGTNNNIVNAQHMEHKLGKNAPLQENYALHAEWTKALLRSELKVMECPTIAICLLKWVSFK